MDQSVGLETYAPVVATLVHNTHKHLHIIISINLHHQLHLGIAAFMIYVSPVVHIIYIYMYPFETTGGGNCQKASDIEQHQPT